MKYDELISKIESLLTAENTPENTKELIVSSGEALKRNRLSAVAAYGLVLGYERCDDLIESCRYILYLQALQKNREKLVIGREELNFKFNSFIAEIEKKQTVIEPEEYKKLILRLLAVLDDMADYSKDFLDDHNSRDNFYGIHRLENKEYYLAPYFNHLISFCRSKNELNPYDSAFELLQIKKYDKSIEVGEGTYIIPLIVNSDAEYIISENGKKYNFSGLGDNRFAYYRVGGHSRLTVDKDAYFSEPIKLEHSPKRKKLVLSIFIDSVNWCITDKVEFEKLMPKTAAFFKNGTICNNFIAGAEHTYPSMASYITGVRAKTHKMFYPGVCLPISEELTQLPEVFKKQGYYTAKISSNRILGPQFGYTKWDDRYIYKDPRQNFTAAELVTVAIDHISSFEETDQCVLVDFMDTHMVSGYWPMPTYIQTHVPAYTNMVDNEGGSSLYQTPSENRRIVYNQTLKYIDDNLGRLYDYVKEHYNRDEVVVTLFSDHGNATNIDEGEPFMSWQRVNVPLMFYGEDKWPHICNEFIESVDYGHVLCHLAGIPESELGENDGNLPAIFGGEERLFTFSQSLHPQRYYCATILSAEYKLYLESTKLIDDECRVDLSNCRCSLTDWDENPIENEELLKFFYDYIVDQLGDLLIER